MRSAALGIQRDVAAISRCSGRHAVDPWLTNEDGKQEAKDDADEHEIEQHESDRDSPMTTNGVASDSGNVPEASACPWHCQVGTTA